MSLIRLELAQLTRSTLLRTVLALFVALMAFALWLGSTERARWSSAVAATRAHTEQTLLREQENVRLNRQEGFNPPGAPAGQTMDASLPPAPGVILAIGDAALRPSTASISTASRADTLFKNAETASALSASLGALDLTWVAVVLLPLLLIALSHDLLAAERDTARLGLLRVQAGDLRRLVWRRLTLRLALPGALVSAGVIVAVGLGAPPGVGLTWWVIVVLYLLLWALVGALVSARAHTAQGAAATLLLLLWLGFVVVLPAALALAIEHLSPAPSRIAQVIAMREVQLGLQPRTAQLLDRYLTDHPELAGASRSGFARSFFVAQRETEAGLAPVLASYGEMRRQQASWGARLAWLSPPMLAHGALTHVAGTDGARHDAFVRQATDFAAAWRDLLRERLFMDRMLAPGELAGLPRFRFAEPPTHARAAVAIVYLLGLVVLFALLLQRTLASAELR